MLNEQPRFMIRRINHQLAIRITIVIALWIFFWFSPWKDWSAAFPWSRFIISLVIFSAPGICIHYLITNERVSNWDRYLTRGFTFSIAITGLLGIAARLGEFSFSFVTKGFFLIGLASIISAFIGINQTGKKTAGKLNFNYWLLGGVLIALIATGAATKLSVPSLIYEDDFTYNALVNYFQTAEQYTFKFSQALNRMEISRFWLAFWPLVEALIGDLSNLHGLLITGIYIAPALIVYSLLGTYSLGKTLGFSPQIALLAITAQVASLMRLTDASQPGTLFFDRLPEDKVLAAFVLTPIFLQMAIEFLDNQNKRRLITLILGGAAFCVTHPVILSMATLIAGCYGLLNLLSNLKFRPLILMLFVLAFILTPPLILRVNEANNDILEFTMEESLNAGRESKLSSGRLTLLENKNYYGISPDLINGLPYELTFIAVFVGIFLLKKDKAARLITSALVILGIAIFPYTGWIIGLAITPFQLWRLTWLMPFGIAIAFLIQQILAFLGSRFLRNKSFRTTIVSSALFLTQLTLLLGTLYIIPWAEGNLGVGGRKPGFTRWYQEYIEVGDVINGLEPGGEVLVGGPDRPTNDIIPSLSYNVQLISFRNERGGRTAPLWEALIGEETTEVERLNLLRENNVRYLLIREKPLWLDNLFLTHSNQFSLLYENNKLRLYEFSP